MGWTTGKERRGVDVVVADAGANMNRVERPPDNLPAPHDLPGSHRDSRQEPKRDPYPVGTTDHHKTSGPHRSGKGDGAIGG